MSVGSIYLHAPFCARRCFYCDFAVHVDRAPDPGPWLEAIAGELRIREREGLRLADRLRTVYLGGGTPSLLGPEVVARIARVLGPDRLTDPELEFTAEANPESLTPELAEGWAAAGVNRLSIGVQSFQPEVLRWMGRLHGPDGARRAVATARRAGIENLSVDLIFALPASLRRDWTADLEATLELAPPHISLYGLTAETGTGLGRAVAEGRVVMADEERYREAFLEAHERLTGAGYLHYEVSNFALPGAEARHNAVYWRGGNYLGLGNGAHSMIAEVRAHNRRDWAGWRDAVTADRSPTIEAERLGPDQIRLERVWLGLRTMGGVPAAVLRGSRASVLAERWVAAGWAEWSQAEPEGGELRPTAEGWLLLDDLSVRLDSALEADGVDPRTLPGGPLTSESEAGDLFRVADEPRGYP